MECPHEIAYNVIDTLTAGDVRSMTDLPEPIVVLSDVHVNAWSDWRGQLESLRGLWQDAGSVIFNGDTMNSNVSREVESRQEVLDYVDELCRADGVKPLLVAGNSDHYLREPRYVFLGGGKVLVLHGDVLLANSSPWRSTAPQLGAARSEALKALSPEDRETLSGQDHCAMEALRRVDPGDEMPRDHKPTFLGAVRCYAGWLARPRLVAAVLRVWWKMPAIAAEFLHRYAPQAEVIVLGHAHRSGVWHVDGKTIINTGSFEGPGVPLVAQVCDGAVHVRAVTRDQGAYSLGRTLESCLL